MYNGRNPIEDRFGFQTRGTFRCSRGSERIMLILSFIITFLIISTFYYIWGEQYKYIYHLHEVFNSMTGSTDHSMGFALIFTFITSLILIVEIVAVKAILNGVEYNYSADENIFSFVSKKDGVRKTDIHYNDVVSMTFDKRVIFGFIDRGYTVTINTRSLGSIELEYLHNKSSVNHEPEYTPFHIIAERTTIQNIRREQGD